MRHHHPLLDHIRGLRFRVRWLLLLFSLSVLVALTLTCALVLGFFDYWFHIQDRGLRILFTIGLGAVACLTFWRYVWRSFRVSLSDQHLAARIEQRFPELRDRLTSTLDFLRQSESDPTAGSPALRRAVIAETAAAVEAIPVYQVIDGRPARRALLGALLVMALLATLAVLDSRSVQIAAERLLNPFSQQRWPQRFHLVFKNAPRRAPAGGVFEVEVVDRSGQRLPDDVKLHLRYDGAKEQVENMRFHQDAAVFRLESLSRPFFYRATGGDDRSMEWRRLEIVEPPVLQALVVRVHPPAYTGWPVVPSDRNIRAIRDSKIELQGSSSKRLTAAVVRLEDGSDIPARLSDDRFGFSLPLAETPFVIRKSGTYAIQLTDEEGCTNIADRPYEIRCVIDLPPSVLVDEPSHDVYVTAEADVPLKITARDDLALRHVELRFSRSDESQAGEVSRLLYEGPQSAAGQPLGMLSEGETRRIDYVWKLSELKLPPGAQVTYYAAASDYLPQLGQSTARRLMIITAEELHDRLAERQTLILGEVARALQIQREARAQVGDVQVQLRDVGTLVKPDIDRLQGAELSQRQVNRLLTDGEEGVPAQIRQLLSELENNKVDSPEIGRRMQSLLDLIRSLQRSHLDNISAQLTGALKEAQAALDRQLERPGESRPEPPENATGHPPPAAKPAAAVHSAAEHQDQVIASLENALGELAQWDSYRRFFRDVNDLRKEHDNIVQETKRIGQQTLTKDASQLTPQQQADLAKLSDRQRELGRQMDLIQQRMADMAGQLNETDPQAAGVLQDALHQARQQGISAQMRQAADQVRRNQLSQAGQAQQRASEGLRDLLDTLANRRESELARLVKKLRQAEEELSQLRQQQQRLRKEMAEAEKIPDEAARKRELHRLSREQALLQQQAQRLSRQLQRLQAERSGNKLAGASQKMSQAGQQAQQGDSSGAQDAAQQAERDLEQAQQQLVLERQQAELDLAMEELARLEDGLRGLSGRQQSVMTETQRLEEIAARVGRLSRGQLLSLRDLARLELQIREETIEMAEKLRPAPVFHRALHGAAKELQLAAELLDQQQTGSEAQRPQLRAWQQFQNLIAALQPENDDGQQNGQDQQGGDNQGGGRQNSGAPPGDGITTVAQLKMLKLLQEDLKARTRDLQDAIGDAPELTPDQQRRLDELAAEQGELARLLMNLSKPAAKPKQDDPEKLPELNFDDPARAQPVPPGSANE